MGKEIDFACEKEKKDIPADPGKWNPQSYQMLSEALTSIWATSVQKT